MLKLFDKLLKLFGRFVKSLLDIIIPERRKTMKLGDKIFKLRKQNGLSQEELGEKTCVTRQTISNWELGETNPNPEQLKLLSKALNVSIDDLLDNDIKNVLIKKVSNTERLTETAVKTIKYIGIIFAIILAIDFITFIIFMLLK